MTSRRVSAIGSGKWIATFAFPTVRRDSWRSSTFRKARSSAKTRAEFSDSDGQDPIWQEHEAKLKAHLPFRDFVYSTRTDGGRVRHLRSHGKPIYDAGGNFIGYRGTGSEITEQVETEAALQRSQQLLLDAIDTIPEGFSLYDQDDRLVLFNSKYSDMLYPDGNIRLEAGMTFEEIVRQVAELGYVRQAHGRVDDWVRERLALRQKLGRPHVQEREDGRWILVSEHRTSDGGIVAVYSDITELKRREEELAEKTNALERLSGQLAKYLSPQVYDSIFSGRQEVKVASQRKKLTVFFSDIANFTETADRLESEELTQLLNHYLTEMSEIALEHGATIDKYVGDAIVIFFGDPESLGIREDALACVRMAIAMRTRMTELQVKWRNAGIERPLQCRMGVHTDYCTVGNFGSESRMDYTIIGSGVNLASRLETAATPGEILISYETYAHVRDEFDCVEAGDIDVKGMSHPVAAYRVVDMRDDTTGGYRRIREERPNLSVNIDPGAMTSVERRQASEILREALSSLSDPRRD